MEMILLELPFSHDPGGAEVDGGMMAAEKEAEPPEKQKAFHL